jgi:hypothetical protein
MTSIIDITGATKFGPPAIGGITSIMNTVCPRESKPIIDPELIYLVWKW